MFGYTGDLWNSAGIIGVDDYFRDENTWSVQAGYTTPNINSYLPRPVGSKNLTTQTKYLQDASYLRLKWGMQKVRVYFSGENLFTLTGLADQFDPETIGTRNGNGYPLSMTLSCGLSLTF